jgi:hypothetical protein
MFLSFSVKESKKEHCLSETSGITNSTAPSFPRRPDFSATPLKEPQISRPLSLLYHYRKDGIGKADSLTLMHRCKLYSHFAASLTIGP